MNAWPAVARAKEGISLPFRNGTRGERRRRARNSRTHPRPSGPSRESPRSPCSHRAIPQGITRCPDRPREGAPRQSRGLRTVEPHARPAATSGQKPCPHADGAIRETDSTTQTEHNNRNTPANPKHLKSLVLTQMVELPMRAWCWRAERRPPSVRKNQSLYPERTVATLATRHCTDTS